MSIALILFIVAMFLWLISLFDRTPSYIGRASGFLAWVSVLLLFFVVHGGVRLG